MCVVVNDSRMSSGFVSGGVSNPDDFKNGPNTDSWAKAEEAIKLARWQQEEQESKARSGEEKSLYEVLQANKARKQEEFEEKLKFKNQFKPLDEDDVEYLDSIMSEQTRTEQLRKQKLASQLDQFRKAQYEAENAGSAEALENIPKVEDIVPGGWNASGRKRKKLTATEGATSSAGLKIRKMSGASGVRSKGPTPQQPKTVEEANSKTPGAPTVGTEEDAKTGPHISSGLLGLVTYSSDDDD
ncbi:N-terminal domain of NEFA-interacting nuclear protein NIP30-domain-containing protein [Terfezia claveryi]|nr:N-terminal domain of NEFA-interacting nuclear protein NIP30-domain-containing protein [Terfezia claveryi]